MNRRERRIHKRKVRRIGVAFASVAMLAATAGLGGVAVAANGGGGGGTGSGCGVGGCGGGGAIDGPGTGSGFNVQNPNETCYTNGRYALYLNGGPPAHVEDCPF
jgi:hypothetical protein